MTRFRSFYLLPFLFLTFTAYAAPIIADDSPAVYMLDVGDLMVEPAIEPAMDALETPSAADRDYQSSNQPGQTWRLAVEAFRHIDPGRT